MKKIIIKVSVLCLIFAALFFYLKSGSFADNVLHKPQKDELKLYGNVEIREVLLGFRVSGRLKEIYFEEGAHVMPKALLGILDPLPYEIKRNEALASLNQARAALAKMKKGNRSEEIAQANAKHNQVRASLELAEKNYIRTAKLFGEDIVAKKELDAATAQRDALRAELSAADNALALMKKGFRDEDITSAAASLELAEAMLHDAENVLADTKLYAPDHCTVLTRLTEPGTVISAGQPVYSVALNKPIQVRAYVSEAELGMIRLGMKGLIYSDSHPEPLSGTVSYIASGAEFTPKQVQTETSRTDLVYRIRLLVEDNRDEILKNGMPVTVIIKKAR